MPDGFHVHAICAGIMSAQADEYGHAQTDYHCSMARPLDGPCRLQTISSAAHESIAVGGITSILQLANTVDVQHCHRTLTCQAGLYIIMHESNTTQPHMLQHASSTWCSGPLYLWQRNR